ncbi:ECF RNA polymerase sigma-E factor [Planctomycetes bacterium MalM25]|nr:ECF RNA polymerase sigma-E factor [Planctomycetes bacterium MalM25]
MPAPDQSARFRDLLQRNQPRWVGIARAYAPPPDREDLLQEIALQVWKSLEAFDGRASIDTWAYRVALNTALAWKRKAAGRANKLPQAADDVNQLPGDGGSEEAVTRVLDQFLASLSEADRAVMLIFLDGLPGGEAAEVLGVSEGAYRTRLSRLRTRFEETHSQPGAER